MKIYAKIRICTILLIIGLILIIGIVFAINEEFPGKESIPKEIKSGSPVFLLIFFLSILILLIALLFIFRNKAVLLGGFIGGFIGLSWTTILDSLGHYIKVPVTTDIAPDGYIHLSYYFNCGGVNAWECFFFTIISVPIGILLGMLIGNIIKKGFKKEGKNK